MPSVMDPETLNVDTLPGIWSPVQWDLSEEERLNELEQQAAASLLHAVDAPEAILRLLLNEMDIIRVLNPPAGYDPEQQGEWDHELVTFAFKRSIHLIDQKREPDYLAIEYEFEDLGHWLFEIEPEQVNLRRI